MPTDILTQNRTIPESSIDTQTLKKRLDAAEVGETVTYLDLSGTIKRDVQTVAYSNLASAKRQLVKAGKVFEAVRGIGLKRLTDSEVVDTSPRAQVRIRRIIRGAVGKLKTVDYNNLPDHQKTRHNVQSSILGALNMATSSTGSKRIEQHVMQDSVKFDPAKALEMILKK